MNIIWYTYRTEKTWRDYASYVLRHEDHELGTRTSVASFERHPTRSRAYRYATHMASLMNKRVQTAARLRVNQEG